MAGRHAERSKSRRNSVSPILKGKLARQIYLRRRYFASGISRQSFVKRGNEGAALKSCSRRKKSRSVLAFTATLRGGPGNGKPDSRSVENCHRLRNANGHGATAAIASATRAPRAFLSNFTQPVESGP